MRVTQCVFNSRTALYRVFVSPFEKVEALSRRSALSIIPARTLPPLQAPIPNLARHASLVRRFKKRDHPGKGAAARPGLPTDHEIHDKMIMVVDESNRLTGPHQTRKVLGMLDLGEQSLRMVARKPENPEETQPTYAICKILDKRAEREKERKLEKSRKEKARKAAKVKELEMNWAIAPHDLGHRMKQLKTFLEKGYKVDVLLAKKRGSRTATRDEANGLVQSVRDTVAEVPGAKEFGKPDGQPLKVMKLYFVPGKPGSVAVSETASEDTLEDASEDTPENVSENASENTSEDTSESTSERVSENRY